MHEKKVIWITGASSGIGKALALKFANEGLMIKEYHGSLKPTVAKPPIADAEKVTRANRKKDKNLFFNIFLLYNRIWKKKKLFG